MTIVTKIVWSFIIVEGCLRCPSQTWLIYEECFFFLLQPLRILMGRKKQLNPMEAYRRKQKKLQLAKNKKKRQEAKEAALKKRDPEWIMAEIQKLNSRGML